MLHLALLVLCSTAIVWCLNPIVEISTGKVKGVEALTQGGNKTYYAFKGIRYAKKPERFERSEPPEPWNDTYDATYDKSVCYQIGKNDDATEDEDCLFLSVYTPELSNNAKRAVMFWVYGGSFLSGDSTYELFGPDHLLDEGVVFVSINYRLGALGFLSSGDSRLPGNNAIKDVLLGLKWVQANIEGFGGDPNKVTIFGESAGGVITSILIQSQATIGKGFFHRAILQSGHSLLPWSLQRDPMKIFNEFAVASACYSLFGGFNASLNCLKQHDIKFLQLITIPFVQISAIFKFDVQNGFSFAPVIEPNSEHAVLVEGSYEFLTKQNFPNVSIFIGGNSEEGLISRSLLAILRPLLLQVNVFPGILVPEDMYASQENIYRKIGPTIKEYYFPNTSTILASDERIIKYISDSAFNKGLREIISLMKAKTKVYCYVFSYYNKTELGADRYYEGLGQVPHADELLYIFITKNKSTPYDTLIKEKMAKLWTNFAIHGDPTPTESPLLNGIKWPIVDQEGTDATCVDIGNELSIIENPFDKGYKMWKNLYDTYGHPINTYK